MRPKPMYRRDGEEVQTREWIETQRGLVLEFADAVGAVSHDQREMIARLWSLTFAGTAREVCTALDLETFQALFRGVHARLQPLLRDGDWHEQPESPQVLLPPLRPDLAERLIRESAEITRQVLLRSFATESGAAPQDVPAMERFWEETLASPVETLRGAVGPERCIRYFHGLQERLLPHLFIRKWLISERARHDVGFSPEVLSGIDAQVLRYEDDQRQRMDVAVRIACMGLEGDEAADGRFPPLRKMHRILMTVDLPRASLAGIVEREEVEAA